MSVSLMRVEDQTQLKLGLGRALCASAPWREDVLFLAPNKKSSPRDAKPQSQPFQNLKSKICNPKMA